MRNTKKFDLSPQLKLGVGRARSQNKILKFSAIICLVLAVALAINAAFLVIKSKNQLSSTNSPKVLGASTDTKPQPSDTTVQFLSYKVQKGDTLFNISQKYNIDWATLATLNNLQSPFLVKPGDTLKIPR